MGFLNFWEKKKKSTVEPQSKSQSVHPAQHAKNVSPATSVTPSRVEVQKPSTRSKGKKENLGDLFKVNIYNMFKYDPKLVEETSLNGKQVKKYTLKLPDLELSTFYKAEITQHLDGTYDITFLSNVNEIRQGMVDFIDLCINLYGTDFMNKGNITNDDYRDSSMGVFSRIWYNKLRIENVYFTMSLTIYNITPK